MNAVSEHEKQCSSTWIFQGQHFNEGVLSALRAYPEITAFKRISLAQHDYLLFTLKPERDDVTVFAAVITRAGGQIDRIHRIRCSLEETLSSLTHEQSKPIKDQRKSPEDKS